MGSKLPHLFTLRLRQQAVLLRKLDFTLFTDQYPKDPFETMIYIYRFAFATLWIHSWIKVNSCETDN